MLDYREAYHHFPVNLLSTFEMPPQRTLTPPNQHLIPRARLCTVDEQLFAIFMLKKVQSQGATAAFQYLYPLYNKLPLHNSPFRGSMILDRWLSHPNDAAMRAHLGITPHAFRLVYAELRDLGGLVDSKHISAGLKLAIFLYICREALGVRHTAETFQVSLESVSM